jgi:uncharacterized protein YoxC
MDVPRQSVSTVLDAPQQVSHLWEEATELLRRARRVLDKVELIVARVEHKLEQLDAITESSERLLERVGHVAQHADAVATEAHSTREVTEEQARRLQALLDVYQPILERLAPVGQEAVSSLRPPHVRGLIALLDELPNLVDRIEPALDGMGHLVPHLEEVTDRMDNVGQVVEGLPGAKALRRRGQAREEAAD